MHERTGHILEAAIAEFIREGEPVSSGLLYERYDFGIKPAMIRLELDTLEDAGYLEQPHHSAGRVPTDRGYEFFAGRMLGAEPSGPSGHALKNFMEQRAWPALLETLSDELGLLGVVADVTGDIVYKAGLEHLIDSLNWEDRAEIRSVIRDFEAMDGRLPQAAEKMSLDAPQVFIGKKSPVTKSESLSVVCGNYRVGNITVSIMAIGPKRMDYKKAIQIFRSL